MYKDTKKITVSFDLHMESDQSPSNEGSYDHFFMGMQSNINIDNLNKRYECNEDRCSPWGQDNDTRWDRYWFTPKIQVSIDSAWIENGQVYLGFWSNVNQDWSTNFYLDNVKVEINQCEGE